MMAWPLYKDNNNAPAIDTTVPMDLARVLLAFQSNFSILKMTASMKVKAGTKSDSAEAKVGEL